MLHLRESATSLMCQKGKILEKPAYLIALTQLGLLSQRINQNRSLNPPFFRFVTTISTPDYSLNIVDTINNTFGYERVLK